MLVFDRKYDQPIRDRSFKINRKDGIYPEFGLVVLVSTFVNPVFIMEGHCREVVGDSI